MAIVAAVAIGLGTIAALVVLAVVSPSASPDRPAASPIPASSTTPRPSASPDHVPASPPASEQPIARPTPLVTPPPAFAPVTGRYAGRWIVRLAPDGDGAARGAYPSDVEIVTTPRCKQGECAVTVAVLDPRTGRRQDHAVARKQASGYRVTLGTKRPDLCRGADGRTVQDGARFELELTVAPYVATSTGRIMLSVEGRGRLAVNARGRSAGCQSGSFVLDASAEPIDGASRSELLAGLSPVPQPDLVPRPNVPVRVAGVRTVYFDVRGDGASELMRQWAKASSRPQHCGKVRYEWHQGSRQTVSCIKTRTNPQLRYRVNLVTGKCTATGIDLNVRYTMPTARWAGPKLVPRVLVPWWKATLRYVRDHEAGHVRISRTHAARAADVVRGKSCAAASAAISRLLQRLADAQEAYDRREYARSDWPVPPREAS